MRERMWIWDGSHSAVRIDRTEDALVNAATRQFKRYVLREGRVSKLDGCTRPRRSCTQMENVQFMYVAWLCRVRLLPHFLSSSTYIVNDAKFLQLSRRKYTYFMSTLTTVKLTLLKCRFCAISKWKIRELYLLMIKEWN